MTRPCETCARYGSDSCLTVPSDCEWTPRNPAKLPEGSVILVQCPAVNDDCYDCNKHGVPHPKRSICAELRNIPCPPCVPCGFRIPSAIADKFRY